MIMNDLVEMAPKLIELIAELGITTYVSVDEEDDDDDESGSDMTIDTEGEDESSHFVPTGTAEE